MLYVQNTTTAISTHPVHTGVFIICICYMYNEVMCIYMSLICLCICTRYRKRRETSS